MANRSWEFMASLLYQGKKYWVDSWVSGRPIISYRLEKVLDWYRRRTVLRIGSALETTRSGPLSIE